MWICVTNWCSCWVGCGQSEDGEGNWQGRRNSLDDPWGTMKIYFGNASGKYKACRRGRPCAPATKRADNSGIVQSASEGPSFLRSTRPRGLAREGHHTRAFLFQMFVQRSSVQRYAELPSLRYGTTPTPTATQMMGSGPLRVCVSPKARRSTSFDGRPGGTGNYCGLRTNAHDFSDEAPPSVRRVHFADLPPKFNRGESFLSNLARFWAKRNTAGTALCRFVTL